MGKTLIHKMKCGCEFWQGLDTYGEVYPEMQYCQKHDRAELAALLAERDALKSLLKKSEWAAEDRMSEFCWSCGWLKDDGHRPGCELAAALKEKQ